jgi:glycosyltransferase involved in cell wall biosynthesis
MARLQSYKRLDIAIEAANHLQIPLRLAGVGPDEPRLRRLAGPTVRFLGRVTNPERIELYRHCRALIIPGVEDFGLNALEAQAAGRPVIAYAAGGSLETVVEGVTGVLFSEQTAAALTDALREFDHTAYDPDACRAQAGCFDESVFRRRLESFLQTIGVPMGTASQ